MVFLSLPLQFLLFNHALQWHVDCWEDRVRLVLVRLAEFVNTFHSNLQARGKLPIRLQPVARHLPGLELLLINRRIVGTTT